MFAVLAGFSFSSCFCKILVNSVLVLKQEFCSFFLFWFVAYVNCFCFLSSPGPVFDP